MASRYFDKALAGIKPANRLFIQKNLDITEQVMAILKKKKMTQRDLAQLLRKSEPEVSRMLSGFQNLTLKTLTLLESVLGEDIFLTPIRMKEKWGQEDFIPQAKIISFTSTVFDRTETDDFILETPSMAAYSREVASHKPIPTKVTFDRTIRAVS
ncbi:MAG: helix-turn-helix transcriptional regulator [Bacteroidia bacterium]|nr:helix-turn-helix transcriptional regulator [Bacteroidia bacterium]